MGVRTPNAAAVAVATSGLAKLVHIPKVGRLSGVESMTVAAGVPSIITIRVGSTSRLAGATPKLHIAMAPMWTAGLPMPAHSFEPLTEDVSLRPVVVATQSMV